LKEVIITPKDDEGRNVTSYAGFNLEYPFS